MVLFRVAAFRQAGRPRFPYATIEAPAAVVALSKGKNVNLAPHAWRAVQIPSEAGSCSLAPGKSVVSHRVRTGGMAGTLRED